MSKFKVGDKVKNKVNGMTYTVTGFWNGQVCVVDEAGIESTFQDKWLVAANAKALNAVATNATFKTGDRIRLTYKHPMMDDPEYIDDVVAYVSGNYITTKDGQEVRIDNDPCFTVKRI